jgi:hypothetical protein
VAAASTLGLPQDRNNPHCHSPRRHHITGTSVNPARSIDPALIGIGSKPQAVLQLWIFIIAPLIGAGAALPLFKESTLLDPKKK